MLREPQKIVFLMDFYGGPRAGTEVQLLDLLTGLDRRRFDPSLVVFRQAPGARDAREFPCPVHVLGIHRLAHPRSWVRMVAFARLLRQRRVRLVHILFNDASVIGPPFCKLAGTRTVVARRDMGFWYTPSVLHLLRLNRRFVDAVVTNSEAVRRNVLAYEGYPLQRTHVLINGHHPSRFLADPKPGFRKSLGIPKGHSTVLMVANLRPVKRHTDLLHAFARLRVRNAAVHLVLVGEGELETDLRGLAARLKLDGRVHFIGGTSPSDVIPIIKQCDVGVLSSATEGLSNALIEYMACGKPVVCPNSGGSGELVRDGETGFLVNPGDVGALSDRISRLLADPVLAQTMGRRGREMFAGRFTSERMVAEYMTLYDRLLSTD